VESEMLEAEGDDVRQWKVELPMFEGNNPLGWIAK